LQQNGAMLKEEVDADEIAIVVSRWTGIPVSRLLEGEIDKLLRMETRLHERVIGQDEAIQAVSSAVRRGRAGLQDPHRPMGSFLFLGPTGVGKTELARAPGRVPVRFGRRHGADRYERVRGTPQCRPVDRRAARLCRLR
jgi:ATP-dependent Clp protease ATP-binding subunit ClpB